MKQGRWPRYPEYRDSGVEWLGEVPGHWEVLALARVTLDRCDGPFGSGLKSEHYSSSGVRVIRLQNIGRSEFKNADSAFVDLNHARTLGNHSVIPGDILIAGLGDDNNPLGRACVTPSDLGPAMVKADCFRFRLDRSMALPVYVAHLLTATAQPAAVALGTGSTRHRMNLSATARRSILLPPSAEQRAIAAFLDHHTARIDTLIAKNERLLELLEEKRTALITRAVTKGLDPDVPMKDSGVEWLGEVPGHWEVTQLGRLGSLTKGNGGTKADEQETGIPCIRYGDLYTRHNFFIRAARAHVSEEVAENYTEIRFGDVLFAASGETLDEIGKSAVNLIGETARCGGDVILFRPTSPVDPVFMGYTADSRPSNRQKAGMGRGITVMHIYGDQLRYLTLALPPLPEQSSIAAHLDHQIAHLDTLRDKITTAIALLREYRTALISAAVTGKIDVRGFTPPESAALLDTADLPTSSPALTPEPPA